MRKIVNIDVVQIGFMPSHYCNLCLNEAMKIIHGKTREAVYMLVDLEKPCVRIP